MLKTPILLICFNRAEHARRVLERILEAEPQELFVFQDGPREGNRDDVWKCTEVRAVVETLTMQYTAIHKDFRLHTNYSTINLGCGPGPYFAISWFFHEVEYGIILEDDLDPHPLFFVYMEDLMERYKNEPRVGVVTSHNQHRIYTGKNTYYFTYNMTGTWGWGTWARVWKKFDFNIGYNRYQFDEALNRYYHLPKPYRDYENHLYAKWLKGDRSDVWDHQFKYYLLLNGFLDAKPNCCLVSHLGTDADATHAGFTGVGYLMDIHTELFSPMQHPSIVKIDIHEIRRAWIKALKVIVKRVLGIIDF